MPVELTDELLRRSVKFRQANPKASGSKSYVRYERYKRASRLEDVLSLGGSRGDIKNDIEKGFVKFTDGGGDEPLLLPRTRGAAKRKAVEVVDDEEVAQQEEEEEGLKEERGRPMRSRRAPPPPPPQFEPEEDEDEDGEDDDAEEAEYEAEEEEPEHDEAVVEGKEGKKSVRKKKVRKLIPLEEGWFVEIRYRSTKEPDDGEEPWESIESEGPFATKREAVTAAKEARLAEPAFEGWADEFYGSCAPPFDSGDAPDAEESGKESISIEVVSGREKENQRIKAEKSAAASLARARARPVPALPKLEYPGKVCQDDTLKEEDGEDWARFARSPADPELGGRQHAPNMFRRSFLSAVGRVANLCYSVAAYAADPDAVGARYRIHKFAGVRAAERVFVPPPGAYSGGPRAPPAEHLVDAVNTDLFADPVNCPGPTVLEAANLEAAIRTKPKVTHVFVLGLQDDDGLAQALAACAGELEVLCLIECAVSAKVLDAIVPQRDQEHPRVAPRSNLRAIHFHLCKPTDSADEDHDRAWARLLTIATNLIWLHVSYLDLSDRAAFDLKAWASLPKSLRVFGYEATFSVPAFDGKGLSGCIDHLAPSIQTTLANLPNLTYVHVFPDEEAVSRISLDPLKIYPARKDNIVSFGYY